MKEFKIRCSVIGNIMGQKGLGKTGQSYCEMWLKEQLYVKKNEFNSKYTEKGIIMEDDAIDYIAQQLNLGVVLKNEKYFENEFLTGTPDIILKNEVIDIKCSWDCFTFPLFSDEIPKDDYYYQLQGYMDLTGKTKSRLIYVLIDTPLNIIEKEAYWYCKNNGMDELDQDIYEQFIEKMTYQNISHSLKIKVFEIEKNETVIANIKNRVNDCQTYINELYGKLQTTMAN